MEFSNSGSSVYHRYRCAFSQTRDGRLLSCIGPWADVVRRSWQSIESHMRMEDEGDSPKKTSLKPGIFTDSNESSTVRQLWRPDEQVIVSILLEEPDPSPTAKCTEFDELFCSLILRSIRILATTQPLSVSQREMADALVDVFDQQLRYIGLDDHWDNAGRAYFTCRVKNFVRDDRRLEFCLPAFPCKSSNPDKVHGVAPDRGEEMALVNLHLFVQSIGEIYAPGAKLWVISDGQVFSDCIGVDDWDVDEYGAQLRALNHHIAASRGGADRVGFTTLIDLFDLGRPHDRQLDAIRKLDLLEIDHHVATGVNEEAEICRRILMQGCQSSKEALRSRIDSKDASIIRLYRGFSRFMLEDLERNRHTQHLSRSQRRKLSSKISFEMIMRNQAYSNLVELIFPHHIRLSIHAHPNSGPKFGISVLGKSVKATDSLLPEAAAMSSSDLLHVPTPWHNCIVEIEGHPTAYLTKSKVVSDAIDSGDFEGNWVSGGSEGRKAGYYQLRSKSLLTPTAEGTAERTQQEEESCMMPVDTVVEASAQDVDRQWQLHSANWGIWPRLHSFWQATRDLRVVLWDGWYLLSSPMTGAV